MDGVRGELEGKEMVEVSGKWDRRVEGAMGGSGSSGREG